MKQRILFLGIGLFLAALTVTLYDQYVKEEPVTNEDYIKENKQLKETISTLEKKISSLEEDLNETPIASEESNNEPDDDEQSSSVDEEATTIVTEQLYIYDGITLYEIGQQAEDLKLVENGRQLELYLSKPEYARKIQKGQFELTSDMTLKQMAEILTGK